MSKHTRSNRSTVSTKLDSLSAARPMDFLSGENRLQRRIIAKRLRMAKKA